MRIGRIAVIIFLLANCFSRFIPAVNAQVTYGELTGTVSGPNDEKLYDAKVSIKNLENGNARSRRTLKNGSFKFPILLPGSYEITVSKDRFSESKIIFEVQLNKKNIVEPPDFTLTPGDSSQTLNTADGNRISASGRPNKSEPLRTDETATGQQDDCSFLRFPLGDYVIFASFGKDSGKIIKGLSIQFNDERVAISPARMPHAASGSQSASPAGNQANGRAGRAQLTHTLDASRSSNFSQREMLSLPLGGAAYMRSFDELALLVPGISPPPYTPGIRGPGIGFGIGTAGEFSSNGMRARSNNFSIDGSDNNDPDVGVRRQGFVAVVPQSLESVNDISISTLLWDAELGRNFGAQVNTVSKYGENAFHGQVYAFLTDSRLNARNGFDFDNRAASGKEDPFTRTQTGFALGGPIAGNRTQFFSSFEHQGISSSTEQHFSVPTMDERRFRGLSKFLVSSGSIGFFTFGVRSGATPLGNNILSFYPLPNNPGGPYAKNTYTEILPADGRGEVASFKVTHQITARSSLNARYNFTDDNRVLPSINRAIRSSIESASRSQNLSLVFDAEIKPSMVSLGRFSFGRTRLDFNEYPGNPFIFSSQSRERVETETGPRRLESSTGPIGEIIIEPYSPVGVDAFLFPQGRVNNTFQYADLIYWQREKHSIKFGGDIRRVELNSRQDRLYRPLVTFGNGVIINSILDGNGNPVQVGEAEFFPGLELATLGLPSSTLQAITIDTPDSTIGLRFSEYRLFVNDNYRVSKNFTLDYGLRYERNTVPHEQHNRIEDSLMLRNLSTEGLPKSNTIFQDLKKTIAAYSKIVAGRNRIYDADPNDVGGQLGFAWDPWADGKTAVRGGYGVYYDVILGSVVSQSRNVFPKEIPINSNFGQTFFLRLNNPPRDPSGFRELIQQGTLNQLAVGPDGLADAIGRLLASSNLVGGGLSFTLPQKNLRTPYAQHWHLTVERELFGDYLLSAAYVGTRGNKLTRLITPNLGPQLTPDIPFVAGGLIPRVFESFSNIRKLSRPDPALGAYQIIEDSASSTYHALQLEARKRYSHGILFTAAYAWSHAIDDVSDLFPIAGAPTLAQDQNNLRLERGDANFDVRHRLAVSFVWDLPFLHKSRQLFARLLKNWQMAGIFQANSGQPFTLNLPLDVNQDGNLTDRPRTTEGLIFFDDHTGRRVALAPGRTVNDFFRFGQDGFVGRNTVRGDNFINLDLSLTKSFRFSDRQRLEVRSEFFNLLNRENFGLPIRVLGAPGFGSSVDTINSARIIQFAIKYQF